MRQAFRAVFWSFFGVRKHAEYEADTQRLTPQAIIVAGLICVAFIVLALYGIVELVTR